MTATGTAGTAVGRPVTAMARLLAAAALGAALLAGCGGDGAKTSCSLDACTVTFDVGANASTSVLGIDAKLIGSTDNTVTVEVAGQQLSLTAGQPATEVAGLQVSLDSVTETQAVVRIARSHS